MVKYQTSYQLCEQILWAKMHLGTLSISHCMLCKSYMNTKWILADMLNSDSCGLNRDIGFLSQYALTCSSVLVCVHPTLVSFMNTV